MNTPRRTLFLLQIFVAVVFLLVWHFGSTVSVTTNLYNRPVHLLPPFFFSTPIDVGLRVIELFVSGTQKIVSCRDPINIAYILTPSDSCFGQTIWQHLAITLAEAILAFVLGALGGTVIGFWFARKPLLAAVFDPYVKIANSMPRVVLAPIFMLWVGLGIWSKVLLGFTLVFFVVFFNVYQGVKEVNPVILNNARMLGLTERQLFRHVYWPSALSWVFSSLHTSVGFAIVAAVVGEYLGAAAGLGYLIQQAEGTFDVTGVFAGMVILAAFVLSIDTLVTVVEKRLLIWRPTVTEATA